MGPTAETSTALDCNIDDKELIKAAKAALERPSDFGYYGELPLFITWGLTMGKWLDSDALERSNYDCVLTALREAIQSAGLDPADYVDIVHCGHFMIVSGVDKVAIRVLIDAKGEVRPDNITPAFQWLAATLAYLSDDYPVFDETHYNELLDEETLEVVTDSLERIRNDAENRVMDEEDGARVVPDWVTASNVLARLNDNGEDSPRKKDEQYAATETAVWELVAAGPITVDMLATLRRKVDGVIVVNLDGSLEVRSRVHYAGVDPLTTGEQLVVIDGDPGHGQDCDVTDAQMAADLSERWPALVNELKKRARDA